MDLRIYTYHDAIQALHNDNKPERFIVSMDVLKDLLRNDTFRGTMSLHPEGYKLGGIPIIVREE